MPYDSPGNAPGIMPVSSYMRWVAVVGSVGLHLALVGMGLALAAALPDDVDDDDALPAPAAAPIARLEPEAPIEVVLLPPPAAPDPAVAAIVAAAVAPPVRHVTRAVLPAGRAEIEAATATAVPSGPSEPTGGNGAASGRDLFDMRGPSLVLPADVMAKLAEGGRELPGPVHRSGKLHDAPNGTGVVEDLVTTATVARDGTVSFADKPDIDYKFHIPGLPTPSGILEGVRDAGHAIGEWAVDPYEQTRYGKTQDLPRHLQATPGGCDSQNTMCDDVNAPAFEKKSREAMRGQVGFGGTMDITAALMKRFHVGDPWAARKLKILHDTFDERVAKGEAFHGDQLARSAEMMQANLKALWATAADAAERRAELFALWDECAEGEGPSAEAGGRARLMVIGWIRGHLPAGSPDAFSAAEIAALSARRASHEVFVPYERAPPALPD